MQTHPVLQRVRPKGHVVMVDREITERLGKRIAKAREDLGKTQAKLSNENFVRNAPPQVVATERERAAELERTMASLEVQLERIRGLGGS